MTLLRFVLTALFFVAPAAAHDMSVSIEIAAPTVIARVSYGSHDPSPFCDVLIYRPGERKREFQNGRTDANGVFAFAPDQAGEWLFVADDGLAHRVEKTVTVDFDQPARAPSGAPLDFQKALTGVSLIFGATGVLLWIKTRRTSSAGNRP